MVFIKALRNQLLLAWPLAAAVTALTVTACGGGSAAAVAQGAAGPVNLTAPGDVKELAK